MYKIKICLFILVLSIVSCQRASRGNKTYDKVSKLVAGKISENTKAVFLITDNDCIFCHKIFAEFSAGLLKDPTILFVISSVNAPDVFQIETLGSQNIIFDTDKELYLDDDIDQSTVFLLQNGKLDTVLIINADVIKNQLYYVDSVIKSGSNKSGPIIIKRRRRTQRLAISYPKYG